MIIGTTDVLEIAEQLYNSVNELHSVAFPAGHDGTDDEALCDYCNIMDEAERIFRDAGYWEGGEKL